MLRPIEGGSTMITKPFVCAGLALSLSATGCGSDDPVYDPLFVPKPECEGAAITPYAGSPRNIISNLEIGDAEDGFDLDGDRDPDGPNQPDNKMSAVGNLAGDAIRSALDDYSIVIPIEFFDLPAAAPDTCVKFALYLGDYALDNDGDGDDTAVPEDGDCDDTDAAINRNAVEVVGDFVDNDCDGLADEDPDTNAPSTSNRDDDNDLVTVAEGDCNDNEPAIVGPTVAEVCGDGLDNDCDGTADRGLDGQMAVECNPLDLSPTPESVMIDPLSFGPDSRPVIMFDSGEIVDGPNGPQLKAGPGLFSVNIPVTGDLNLDLRITGVQIEGDVVMDANGIRIENGRLGGIIDAVTADKIMGLEVEEIGLTPDKTLLDATFANLLGPLLALPRAPDNITAKYDNCRGPDIDADGDGPEWFCDMTPDDEDKAVTVCIDGNGSEVKDVDSPGGQCTNALDSQGRPRFVDGISVEINFSTVPAGMLIAP
jgi:hypothetical protein